eukprot:COSAG02_NODE_1294_length_13401_cov_32.784393_8_plen_280_part_00
MQRLLWQKVLLLAPAVLLRSIVPTTAAPTLASCTGSVAQKWEFGTGLWDGFLVAGNTWFGTVPTAATVPLTAAQRRQLRPEQQVCSLQLGANCDGGDLSDIGPATPGDCCRACTSEPTCVAFTVNGAGGSPPRHCFLKNRTCGDPKVAPPDSTAGVMHAQFPQITAKVLSADACSTKVLMADVGSTTVNSTTCCDNAANMRFRLSNATSLGQGLLQMAGCGKITGYCVESGQVLFLAPCNTSNDAQRWYFDPYGGTGVFGARGYLVHTASRQCLDSSAG